MKLVDKILKEKVIAILREVGKEKLLDTANALYEGGIKFIEITYSTDGKVSDEETASMISMLSKSFEGKMDIGAGTVLTTKQVELTKAAGGKFIISPDTNEEIIKKTKELGLVSIPGALTPTEIRHASMCGADLIKLFPADAFGPAYIKTVLAPLSNVKILAFAGINFENVKDYINAGAVGVGVGSCVLNKKLIAENDYQGIKNLAKQFVEKVK